MRLQGKGGIIMTDIGIFTQDWNIIFKLIHHRGVRITSKLGNYVITPLRYH